MDKVYWNMISTEERILACIMQAAFSWEIKEISFESHTVWMIQYDWSNHKMHHPRFRELKALIGKRSELKWYNFDTIQVHIYFIYGQKSWHWPVSILMSDAPFDYSGWMTNKLSEMAIIGRVSLKVLKIFGVFMLEEI